MKKNLFLFLVILIEGYVVLSSELLAIRQTMPYTGSGTDTISIIIAAVLLPMAFGYFYGGRFYATASQSGKPPSIRQKLIRNIIISMLILVPGLSHVFIDSFFHTLLDLGMTNRVVMVSLYAALFLVTPVFLLAQTIPLISNYFSKEVLAKITGRILFFSTLGSFLGAVFSTLVLMAYLGVNETAAINFILLAFLVVLLSKPSKPLIPFIMVMIAIGGFTLNSDTMLAKWGVVSNNQYNVVRVLVTKSGGRLFSVNNNNSSRITPDGKAGLVVLYVEDKFLNTIDIEAEPQRILVVGAGGFTFGMHDDYHKFDIVDIDPALKDVAEDMFLGQELSENRTFHPVAIRGFLQQNKEPYDLIFVDVFSGNTQIPEQLVTREFFEQLKSNLAEDGAIAFNFVVSPTFETPFSRHIHNTVTSVFPHMSRVILHDYNGWGSRRGQKVAPSANVIYTYVNRPQEDNVIYTDLQNTMFQDTPKERQKFGVKFSPSVIRAQEKNAD